MESQVCLSLLPGTLQLYYSNPKPEGILGQTIKTAHHIKVENLLFQLSFTKRAESEHFQVGAKCEMCNKGEHFLLSVHWSSRLCWLHFGSTSRSAAGKVEFSTRLDLPPPLLLLHLLDDFLWRAGSPGAPFVVSTTGYAVVLTRCCSSALRSVLQLNHLQGVLLKIWEIKQV